MTAKVKMPVTNPNDPRLWPMLFVEIDSHISGVVTAYRVNHILVTEDVYGILVERAKQQPASKEVLFTEIW